MTTEKQVLMIDLETLGASPGAAIVALAAVEFDPCGEGLGRTLYRRVDLRSAVAAGLVIEPETVLWWLKQDDAARAELTSEATVPLHHALRDLTRMMAGDLFENDTAIVWANGASFDFPILAAAYRAIGHNLPWKYWNERDWRTVRQIGPRVELARVGHRHNALDDACHQALHLQRVLARWRAAAPAEAA